MTTTLLRVMIGAIDPNALPSEYFMAVAVPSEFAAYVADGVASGRFRSEEEAIAEGLRLLQNHDRKLAALKADLQAGLDDLNAGNLTELDPEDIKRRGRERLKAGKAAS